MALLALALLRPAGGPGAPATLKAEVIAAARKALDESTDRETTSWAKFTLGDGYLQITGEPPTAIAARDVTNILKNELTKYVGLPGVIGEIRPTPTPPRGRETPPTFEPAPETSIAGAEPQAKPKPPLARCREDLQKAFGAGDIRFRFDRSDLQPQSHAQLNLVAEAAKRCAAYKIEIAGHTDANGPPASNMALSQARAQAVVNYLVSRGVPAGALTAKGYGATKPVTRKRGPAADALNRRISFDLSEP